MYCTTRRKPGLGLAANEPDCQFVPLLKIGRWRPENLGRQFLFLRYVLSRASMQCPFLKYELDRSLPANATRTLRDLAKRSSLPAKLENRRRTSQNQECRRAQTQIFASKAARFASQLCFPRGLPCCSCGLRDIKLFPDPLRPGHRQSGYRRDLAHSIANRLALRSSPSVAS